jgi:cell shape-determining protein MreC
MNKIGQMVQPLQKQPKSETRTEFIKEIHSQLKQLQKGMSQVQKESQRIKSSLTFSTKKNTTTKRKSTKKK